MTFEEFNNKFGGEDFYYVYEHILDGEVFYVGKGVRDRAINFHNRNPFWKKHTKGKVHLINVQIKAIFEEEEDSFLFEESLIYKYLTRGIDLCNINYNFNDKEKVGKKKKKYRIKDEKTLKNKKYISELTEMSLAIQSALSNQEKIIIFTDKSKSLDKLLEGYSDAVLRFNLNDNEDNREEEMKALYKGIVSDKANVIYIYSAYIDFIERKIKSSENIKYIVNLKSKERLSKTIDLIGKNAEVYIYLPKSRTAANSPEFSSITPEEKIENKRELVGELLSNIEIPENFLGVKLTAKDKKLLSEVLSIKNTPNEILRWPGIKRLLKENSDKYVIYDGLTNINKVRTRYSIITLKN